MLWTMWWIHHKAWCNYTLQIVIKNIPVWIESLQLSVLIICALSARLYITCFYNHLQILNTLKKQETWRKSLRIFQAFIECFHNTTLLLPSWKLRLWLYIKDHELLFFTCCSFPRSSCSRATWFRSWVCTPLMSFATSSGILLDFS